MELASLVLFALSLFSLHFFAMHFFLRHYYYFSKLKSNIKIIIKIAWKKKYYGFSRKNYYELIMRTAVSLGNK